jgi:hypothetical protein
MIGDKRYTEALDVHLKMGVVEERSQSLEAGWRLKVEF